MLKVIQYTTLASLLMIPPLLMHMNAYASYVIYHNNTAITNSIGSIPYDSSGFSYTGPGGDSVSYREIRYTPILYNQYPNAVWVEVHNNNNLPANAIIYQYVNGRAVFYCKVFNGNQIEYGWLVPNEGCFLFSYPQDKPYSSYQILVR